MNRASGCLRGREAEGEGNRWCAMYGVAEEYSDDWPGRSGESAAPAAGEVAKDDVISVGDWRVGLCEGACSGFFGNSDRGGECNTSD